MPEHVKAELIEGIVYMASPQKNPHGWSQGLISHWLGEYEGETPGTRSLFNSTSILGPESEPQPDACLIVLPECGGKTWEDEDQYLHGGPELVVEVSSTSESIDLNSKKRTYEKAGVQEYLVLALEMEQVFWFIRRRARFTNLAVGPDGIIRSEVFPGLWLDVNALLRRDRKRLLSVLRKGVKSEAHAEFTTQLDRKRKK